MNSNAETQAITDALGSDSEAALEHAGTTGKILMSMMDRAVHMQSPTVTRYVNWLRSRNPEATPADIQDMLDKHFVYVATGSGASAGMAAAVPGIGFVTGAAAVGAESLVFLDAAALYTMASAYLRGADIADAEHRKALLLIVILGSSGTAIVDAAVGDVTAGKKGSPISTINRFNASNVGKVNNLLLRQALKTARKRLKMAWLGKIMPLGIGAVVGTITNRKLAKSFLANAAESLGAPPADFPRELPDPATMTEADLPDTETTKNLEDEGFISRTVGSVGGAVAGAAHSLRRKLPFFGHSNGTSE